MTRFRLLRNQLLVAAAALLLVTCTDNPTGPTVGGTVHLAVSPRFKAGVTLSAALPIDQVRLTVYHQPACDCSADSVAGATAPFALTQDSIQMQLSFTLLQSPETLEVHFDLLGGGQTLFSGDTTVIIRAGVPATVPPLSVYYNGPGYDIAYLNIAPRDSVLTFGDSLQFQASGSNSSEAPETAFYVSWRSGSATAKVRPDGMIKAPNQRLTTTVTAQTPNGVLDSTTITFVPKPVSLAKVSGDTQAASVNDTLPLPLRVRVKAADSLGVAGVRVVFHPLGLAGPAVPDTAYTDSLGFAQVRAVLGDSTGSQQWQASVSGLSSVTFTATSQVVAGPPFQLHVVTQPADSQVNGALVVPPMVLQVEDSVGLPVHQAGIAVDAQTWSWLDGAPRPTRKLVRAPIRRAGAAGPYRSAYAFGVLTDSTDANGRVTFAGFRLTGYGDDRVVFNSAGLVADTSIDLFVKEGPPKYLQKGSSDSTSGYVDSLVSAVPSVWVYDTTYNPVPHAAVLFQVTAGSGKVNGAADSITIYTDSSGYAAVPSWTLGPIPGANSLQATVGGAGSLTFTAFAQPPVPTVLLQLQGTSVIGVGRTATLQIHLSAPAGAGGDSVQVSSDNTGIVSVAGPGIFVAAGDSLGSIVLNGVAAGTDTIRATATGYIAGALGVTASINLISLPATLTVPFGGTTAIGVTLAAPAPPGGVVVTLVSSDSTKVQVLTPTVSFAQGVQSQNGQIGGVALGVATLTASNPNYSPATTSVTTAANLNIVAASATIYPVFPDSQTIQFLSSGTPIAAPAGGILVTLTAANSACVTVPATATIIAGLSTALFPVSYSGFAALPCTSYVTATASGVGPDSVLMTVSKPPVIGASTFDVGAGLQGQVYISLQTAIQGNSNMTIRPLTVGVARFAPNLTTLGVDTLVIPLVNGTSSVYATVAGVDTVTNDSTYVEVSIPGYATDTALVRVRTPGVTLYGVPASTTSLSSNSALYGYIGLPYVGNTGIQASQGLRVGHAPVTATFHLTPSAVAELTDSTGVLDTVRTAVVPQQANVYYTPTSVATGGVGYHPVGAGSSTTTINIPGFITLPATTGTIVSAPTFSAGSPQVGSGLQTTLYVSFGAPVPASSQLTVTSLKPTVLVVADSVSHVGADSTKIALGTGVNYTYVYVAGLEGVVNDSSQLVFSIPGFKPDTVWGYVRQAGIQLVALPTTTTTFTPKSQFYATIGLPYIGNTAIYLNQPIRTGAPPLTVAFHTSSAAVGTLTDSTLMQDTVRTAVIPVNPSSGIYYTPTTVATGGVAYQPVGPGQSTTWATLPGFVTVPADTVKTTVSAPILSVSAPSVGAGLQTQTYVGLGAPTPSPTTMTVKSLNPAVTVVSDTITKVGVDSVVIPLAAATTYQYVYVSGLEGVINDSTRLVLSVPGYTPDTVWSYVRQAGVVLSGVNTATTTLSDSNLVYAQIGLPYVGNTGLYLNQSLRAGSAGASFLIKPSDPTVQRMVTTGGQADSAVVLIPAGQYYSPFTVATGGAALKVLTSGIDTARVTGAGFVSVPGSAPVVTVSAPAITVNAVSVGAGLAVNGYSVLGASQHGGDTVTVWSSNPGVALVAPNATTPGTDSIKVFVPNGQTSVPYYVIGVDSMVGTPIIYASANGFNQGSATATVVQPIVEMSGPTASQTAGGADNAFYAYIGIPYSGTNSFYNSQIRAAGKPAFTVTFSSSAPAVGTLTTTALTAGIITEMINVGSYYTPTSVAGGGVAFRPLTAGSSTVSASIPGFLQTVNATGVVVTVH
ncbi:MAG: hypothetical protein WBC97_10765 [Gemmatimonadales bacterium]